MLEKYKVLGEMDLFSWILWITITGLKTSLAQMYDDRFADDISECRTDSHEVLHDPARRVLETVPLGGHTGTLCDSTLTPGWYRFSLDGRAADMAGECTLPNQCGTSTPIWLRAKKNESIETYDDRPVLPEKHQSKSIMACVSVQSDCCAHLVPVQVRNCGEYFVYFLWITKPVKEAVACPSFCAESKAATTRKGRNVGPRSLHGSSPRVSSTDQRVQGGFRLRCTYDKPSRPEIANQALYRITWTITQHGTKELFHADETTETFSEATVVRIDVTVTCSVRIVDRRTPTSELQGVEESAGFYIGLKMQPQVISIREGETQTVTVTSSVPFPCQLEDRGNCVMRVFLAARNLDSKDNLPPNVMITGCSVAISRISCQEGVCGKGKFEISGVQDFANDGTRKTLVETIPILAHDAAWAGYDAPDVEVTITDVDTSQCYSYTDPHIVTLDGALYDLHTTGTFVMYESTERDFKC
uniref:von Willebrand factor D and EGF domain-containing protein-like n=1 Tax=Styela clava TaxID=7725 RepID=UPI00193A8451|nr:von Willebrand factor D and EGF domain-containing protein-like [Styela clava]